METMDGEEGGGRGGSRAFRGQGVRSTRDTLVRTSEQWQLDAANFPQAEVGCAGI